MEAVRRVLRGAALAFYSSMNVPKMGISIMSADDLFALLRSTFVSEAHQKTALAEFRTLEFEKFRETLADSHPLEDALHLFYERAMHLHQMLPPSYSDDAHLRDMLLQATENCRFVSHLPENEPASFYDAYQLLYKAIGKYEARKSFQKHGILAAE
jgi:hypothetical protein